MPEPTPPRDSLLPHVRAILGNPLVWTWVARVLIPAAASFAVKPAMDWLKQIREDHVAVGMASKHVTALENAKTEAERASLGELLELRGEQSRSTRALVEYVAGARHMDVQSVLDDYDALVDHWRRRDPACLDARQCDPPAAAARKALAAKRGR